MFEPLPHEIMAPGPAHDLSELSQEMLRKGAEILQVPELGLTEPPEWTTRILKGWFGQARWEDGQPHGSGRIRINVLLDSPELSRETMLFLLWHEFLHLYLQAPHTQQFRKLERKWPGYIEADNELDTLNERFACNWW